jgi:hypothetical protein
VLGGQECLDSARALACTVCSHVLKLMQIGFLFPHKCFPVFFACFGPVAYGYDLTWLSQALLRHAGMKRSQTVKPSGFW